MAETRDILAFVEASADARVVQTLVDRAIQAEGGDTTQPCTHRWLAAIHWHAVPAIARTHGIKAHGFFAGEPGAPDALAARRALRLAAKIASAGALIVLVRDADAQPEREVGLSQARDESPSARRIAIGVAKPEREAWVLVGFSPRDAAEREALGELRRHLGFDPTTTPERLGGRGKRDAKSALAALTRGDLDRERECVELAPLATLRDRGASCGLAAFLGEVAERVAAPIVSGL